MKNRFVLMGLSLALVLAYCSAPVQAQDGASGSVMTDSHIQRIKQNCRAAARTIQQIHVNDGPLRVNRGQVYDSILSKLITPFNSRLILNKYDASSLVKIAAQYDKALTAFRDHYKKYDDQMSAVLRIDCVKQPVSFYDAVVEARKRRTEVNDEAMKIHGYITDYGQDVIDLRNRVLSPQNQGDDAS